MALPLMDSDPTIYDRVPHRCRITAATTVAEARADLHATGESAGVVYSQGRPAGVVTADALDRARQAGGGDGSVGAVMDFVAVPVHPGASSEATLRAFTHAAWDWLRLRPA